MIAKMKRHFIIVVMMLLGLWSCELPDPEVEYTATYAVSGEWWVTYTLDGDDFAGGHNRLLTYNTSSDTSDSIWVWYKHDSLVFRVKVGADIQTLTFSADGAVNQVY